MLLNGPVAGYVIHGFWAVLALYWLVHAVGNKRTVYRQGHIAPLALSAGVWVLAAAAFGLRPLAVRVLPEAPATRLAGIALCGAGIALAIRARQVLGANWSGIVTLKEGHELIRRGPYRFVRHPIYSGLILAVAGSFVALLPTLQGFACVLLTAGALKIKSRQEERVLCDRFPEYARYKQRVNALIPFVC